MTAEKTKADIKTNIREYAEGMPVEMEVKKTFYTKEIVESQKLNRLVVRAYNQGGFDITEVDVGDIIEWVRKNKPELLKEKV